MPDKVASCNKCGAPIMFMTQKGSTNGKTNPINRHPMPNGNLKISFDRMEYQIVGKTEVEKDRAIQNNGGIPSLYLSHFATCVYAQQFRRKKQ
jgi:hypothetical protein